jgi:hypothetical protein
VKLDAADLHRNWPTGPQDELLRIITTGSDVRERWQDWSAKYEIRNTDVYRLVPALYRRLSEAGLDEGAYLRGVVRHCFTSGVVQQQAARDVRVRLDEAQIPSLVLKGLAISLTLGYTPRHMGDVDIMVPIERVGEAIDLVLALGWTATLGINTEGLLNTLPLTHATGFDRGGLQLDLHWHSVHQDPSPTFNEPLWKRASKQSGFFVPSKTDLLLQTVMHGVRHDSCAHAWPGDLYAIHRSDNEPVDWDLLVDTAVARRLLIQLQVLLAAFDTYIPGEVPVHVRDAVHREAFSKEELLEHRGLTSRNPLPEEAHAVGVMRHRRQTWPGFIRTKRGRLF